MANQKISDLTEATDCNGSELVAVVQGGATKKASLSTRIKAYFDTLYATIASVPTITAPTAWTATSQGFGTVSSQNLRSWRVGSHLHFEGVFTPGTTSGSEARLNLGSAGTDGNVTTSSGYGTLEVCGIVATTGINGAAVYCLVEASKTYITFGIASAGIANALTKVNGNAFSSSTAISVKGSVRIQGW